MPVDVVLFDLDGTLVDSAAGIAGAADRALAAIGRPPLTPAQLRAFVGPPLRESFVGLGIAGDELDAVVDAYRHHYLEDGILDFEVYPGVVPLLDALRRAGLRLGVATSKRTESARRVLAQSTNSTGTSPPSRGVSPTAHGRQGRGDRRPRSPPSAWSTPAGC